VTITVYGPAWCAQWIHPTDGVLTPFRLSYKASGQFCYPLNESLDPSEVAHLIDRMQDVVPLGGIGDYDVLCLDHMLAWDDPTAGQIIGQRFPGYIALSGRISIDLYDLLTHELTHSLDRTLLTERDRDDFFAIVGQAKGSEYDTYWINRPQERMAEYISLALWDVPLRLDVQPLDAVTIANVRTWALAKFGGAPRARVVAHGMSDYIEIRATEGSNFLLVDGVRVFLDDIDPLVVADIVRGRFRLPMTSVNHILKGKRPHWDVVTRTGTWWIPRKNG
jgi:hypothetical protein